MRGSSAPSADWLSINAGRPKTSGPDASAVEGPRSMTAASATSTGASERGVAVRRSTLLPGALRADILITRNRP